MTKNILATTALATLLATALQAQTTGGNAGPTAGGAATSDQETVSPGSPGQTVDALEGAGQPISEAATSDDPPVAQDSATMPTASTSNDAGTITNPEMTNEGPTGIAEEVEPAVDQATTTEEGTGATGNVETTTAPAAADDVAAGSAEESGATADPAVAESATGASEGALAEEGSTATDLGSVPAEDLQGAEIVTQEDETVATIEDVLIGDAGQVEGVVARFGGFLGFGSNRVRLEADELEITRDDNDEPLVRTSLTPESIEGRPEYQDEAE